MACVQYVGLFGVPGAITSSSGLTDDHELDECEALLVVQTHIHISQSASLAQTATTIFAPGGDQFTTDKAKPSRDNYPINQDPANCPLCQELTHSGQFLHSVAVLIALPCWVTVNFIPYSEVVPSLFSVSHSWQGRAPPQA